MESKSSSIEGKISPIEKVPVEILTIIFTHASALGSNSCTTGLETPDSISRVNSHWRRVSLDLPSLWSLIIISATCPLARSLSRTTLWLERSQTYPLTVLIDFEESAAPRNTAVIPDIKVMKQICVHLTPHVDRWDTFTVKVSHQALLQPFERFLTHQPAQFRKRISLVSRDIVVRGWRFDLQGAMLSPPRAVTANEMPLVSDVLKKIEQSQSTFNFYVLAYSKLSKVLRHIAAKNPEDIPLNEELQIHNRVLALLETFNATIRRHYDSLH